MSYLYFGLSGKTPIIDEVTGYGQWDIKFWQIRQQA
ncbi:hypothetical protein FDK33_15830 [Citrobacter werkmanii]|nr:hypothetical protein [Citrobacter werkmanii]MBQ4937361.1 hypothetical protein [Citrobacter werkmanii]MBQ4950074.1 hypothetical protein [Citrobacter werkmanii]MBQ4965898.1 hypothetical protein [Citrobacter werkmanii]HCT9709934.1 hypothetical protein [Citrobacter werkmanii]